MTLQEFKNGIADLDYDYSISNGELTITDFTNSEWYGYCVARVLIDEEYCVYYDYAVPFKSDLYTLIFEFISTPFEKREM